VTLLRRRSNAGIEDGKDAQKFRSARRFFKQGRQIILINANFAKAHFLPQKQSTKWILRFRSTNAKTAYSLTIFKIR
jgi:hypothetical protein